VACQEPPEDDCAEPLPEDTDGPEEKPFDVDPLLDVELLESSPDDVLDEPVVPDVPEVLEVPDELDVPEDDVEPVDVDDPEVLLFLLASVSVLATAAKAREPTAVAVSRLPVTKPTRRKP
jgi:hypothetical protein